MAEVSQDVLPTGQEVTVRRAAGAIAYRWIYRRGGNVLYTSADFASIFRCYDHAIANFDRLTRSL